MASEEGKNYPGIRIESNSFDVSCQWSAPTLPNFSVNKSVLSIKKVNLVSVTSVVGTDKISRTI